VVQSMLPQTPEMTLLDKFMSSSYLLAWVSGVLVVFVEMRKSADRDRDLSNDNTTAFEVVSGKTNFTAFLINGCVLGVHTLVFLLMATHARKTEQKKKSRSHIERNCSTGEQSPMTFGSRTRALGTEQLARSKIQQTSAL